MFLDEMHETLTLASAASEVMPHPAPSPVSSTSTAFANLGVASLSVRVRLCVSLINMTPKFVEVYFYVDLGTVAYVRPVFIDLRAKQHPGNHVSIDFVSFELETAGSIVAAAKSIIDEASTRFHDSVTALTQEGHLLVKGRQDARVDVQQIFKLTIAQAIAQCVRNIKKDGALGLLPARGFHVKGETATVTLAIPNQEDDRQQKRATVRGLALGTLPGEV